MLRLSSYFILSDRLRNGGYAVLSGLTGAIEFINEDLYKIFKQMAQAANPHELYIEESDFPADMIETYLNRGHITNISHDEERRLLESVAAGMHKMATAHPSVVIVPDLDCNYRCVYCFERPLQARLKAKKTKMDIVEVGAAYKSIDQIAAQSGSKINRITLFGGEPLLAANKDIVRHIVDKGVERGISFSAVTNGHDLDAFMNLLDNNKIGSLQITIDGPPSIHDKRRVALDGSSSFAKIIANMRRAIAETDVRISIRVNLDEENYPAFAELLHVFGQENWLGNNRVFINAAIVYEKDAAGAAFPLHDINKVRSELLGLVQDYPNVEIGCQQANQSDLVFSSLIMGKPYALRSSYCAASSGAYVFLPGGKISCCWETIGEQGGYIGSYGENGLMLDEGIAKRRFGRSAALIPKCADCKYCLVCAGGCSQYAEFNLGDIYQPYCGDFPQTYAWVLADAVENFLRANGV